MAGTVLASLTDAIPLLDLDSTPGSPTNGQYVVGRNTAADIRRGLLTPLVGAGGATMTARSGVFGRQYEGTASPKRWRDAFVKADTTATRIVTVQAFQAIVSRTATGPYTAWLDADTQVTLPNADGTNPRWDVLCARVADKGPVPADAVHGPSLWLEQGTPAGSPTVPTVPDGCLPLARVYRRAGTSGDQIVQADITQVRVGTSLHGAPRPLMEGDSLATAGGYHGERRLRTGPFVDAALPAVSLVDRWDAINSTWRGTDILAMPEPTPVALLAANKLGGNATHTWASITVPDPGWPYYVEANGSVLVGIEPSANTIMSGVYVQLNMDSTSFTAAGANLVERSVLPTAAYPGQGRFGPAKTAALTGQHIFYMLIRNESVPSNFVVAGNNEYYTFNLKVIPAV